MTKLRQNRVKTKTSKILNRVQDEKIKTQKFLILFCNFANGKKEIYYQEIN